MVVGQGRPRALAPLPDVQHHPMHSRNTPQRPPHLQLRHGGRIPCSRPRRPQRRRLYLGILLLAAQAAVGRELRGGEGAAARARGATLEALHGPLGAPAALQAGPRTLPPFWELRAKALRALLPLLPATVVLFAAVARHSILRGPA